MKRTDAWNIQVWLALGLYVLLMAVAVILALRNILVVVFLAVAVITLVYALWQLFTGRGFRFWSGVILLLIASVFSSALLVYFFRQENNVKLLLVLGVLTAAYTGLVAILRRRYWHMQRVQATEGFRITQFQKPYLIINPKSGNGRAIKADIHKLAPARGITTRVLTKDDDVEKAAEDAVKSGADVLGISGGDGSIGAVAKVAIDHNLPMIVLPGGTRCHFARDIGLDPERIADALEAYAGVEQLVDAGDLNGRVFLNNASFGLYADIVDHPDYRENKIRVSREVLQSLVSGAKPLYDLQFRYDNKRFMQAAQVLVGVNRYKFLNIFELGQRDRLDEGILQVTVIAAVNDAAVRNMLGAMSLDFARHDLPANIYQWDAKKFRISSFAGQIVAGVDGERVVLSAPVRIGVLPRKLRLFVPAEGIRNRPKNPLSLQVIRQAWQSTRT